MHNLIQNDQHLLAEEFCLREIQVNKMSYQAVLIINRWKLIKKIPSAIVGEIVQQHTERMINRSFFTYVPNQVLLINAGSADYMKN